MGSLEKIQEQARERGVRLESIDFPERIALKSGALVEAAEYVSDKYNSVVLVADSITFAAAGRELRERLASAGGDIAVTVTLVHANGVGDVVADEASVVQVLLDLQRSEADALVAVGAGTIHDIVRYAAYTGGVDFISVPTAPSVDGFTSKGAPLLIRGEKITVAAVGPAAIFADIAVLRQAPAPMIAAGFGDMLGKLTSLFDWEFGHLAGGESYDPFVAAITEQALEICLAHVEAIGARTEEGIAVLMQALIDSGLAMLIFGQSHPASGAEHHLSHYWEMAFIREGRKQLLHGAKVGVACAVIADLYRSMADTGELDMLLLSGGTMGAAAVATIRKRADRLPSPARIREWLTIVHGPATTAELGIDDSLTERALNEAHKVRPNRFTLLRARNGRLS